MGYCFRGREGDIWVGGRVEQGQIRPRKGQDQDQNEGPPLPYTFSCPGTLTQGHLDFHNLYRWQRSM